MLWSHSKPRIAPAAEKTVYVLKGKMDRAEKHVLHLRTVAEQKQKEYGEAVNRATEQDQICLDLTKDYWQARRELERKPESVAISDEGEKPMSEEEVEDSAEIAVPSGSKEDPNMKRDMSQDC